MTLLGNQSYFGTKQTLQPAFFFTIYSSQVWSLASRVYHINYIIHHLALLCFFVLVQSRSSRAFLRLSILVYSIFVSISLCVCRLSLLLLSILVQFFLPCNTQACMSYKLVCIISSLWPNNIIEEPEKACLSISKQYSVSLWNLPSNTRIYITYVWLLLADVLLIVGVMYHTMHILLNYQTIFGDFWIREQ